MDEQELRDETVEQNEAGDVTVIKTYDLKSRFLQQTPFSKGLSLVLFVIIPLIALFVGFNAGYNQGFSNAKDIEQSYQFVPTHKKAVENETITPRPEETENLAATTTETQSDTVE